jgi:hypothetical protein
MKSLNQRLLVLRADKVPPGWMADEVMARKEGYSSAESFDPTRKAALVAGLIERKEFRVIWGKALRRRPHYRYV